MDHLVYAPTQLLLEFVENNKCKFKASVGVMFGVSTRIKATSTSGEGSLNLAAIPGLSVSTGVSVASTNVEIDVIGIQSRLILRLPKVMWEINTSSFQTLAPILAQILAVINAEIDGSETQIVPQIIGVYIKSMPEGISLKEVVDAIRDWRLNLKPGEATVQNIMKLEPETGDKSRYRHQYLLLK